MITASVESFTERLDELKPLLFGHWEKLAMDKDQFPLDPQYDTYFKSEVAGELLFVVLRDEGKMVGYWIAFIATGLHHRTCLTATMDIWNILPKYENGVGTMILLRRVHKEYKRRGVQRSIVGEKIHRPCGRLFKAFGYEPIETHHSKLIGN